MGTESSSPQGGGEDIDQGAMLVERQNLASALLANGLISQEFYDSGALDYFLLNEQAQFDGLSHILLGDERGGAHHLRTLQVLGVDSLEVASAVKDPRFPGKSFARVVREQAVRDNGVYRPMHIVSAREQDGHTVRLTKEGGSTMFPDEWSTQEVLEAIIEVSKMDGVPSAQDDAEMHEGTVRGVRMRVFTQPTTGKIMSGVPLLPPRSESDRARTTNTLGTGITADALARKAAGRAVRSRGELGDPDRRI